MHDATILLMEDHDALRRALAAGLQRAGFVVHQAASADQALQFFESGTAIDLVIADLVVPGRENDLLIARLRRAAAGMPVLYVSGYPRCHAVGLFDFPAEAAFLAKPFDLPQLLAAIEELMPELVPPGAA